MRTQPLAGHNQVAQVAGRIRFGRWKSWLLVTLVWAIAQTTFGQERPDIVWMRGTQLGIVNCVAYSPDGSLIASASRDRTIRLWRVSDGVLLRTLRGHTGFGFVTVTSVVFSPDGSLIASASTDATIRLWRVSDGVLLRTLTGHAGFVTSVAFSPDGNLIASASTDATIRLWRVSDGVLLRTLTGHTNTVFSVAFSPDGSLIASASSDLTIRLWRVSDGVLLRTLTGHTHYVNSVAFSPDGSLIASGSDDNTVRLWRVSDGVLLRTLTGHTHYVNSVAFSPDGNLIASASSDRTVRLWRVSDGVLLRTLTGDTYSVNSVAFSPDGSLIASGGDEVVILWRVSDGAQLINLAGHTDTVNSVAFSPDGNLIASASSDRTVRLWRVSDGAEVRTLTGDTYSVNSVAFSPDGNLIASASTDDTIHLWRVSDGVLLRTLTGHTNWVNSVAFSPDGSLIASGGVDRVVILWRVSDGVLLRTLTGHTHYVNSVAFSPDGNLIASASSDRTVRLWRVSDGAQLINLAGHTDTVNSVAFSPDGSLIASGSDDNTVRLWRVSDGVLLRTLTGHTDWVNSVAFSPDGSLIASASRDATIRLWRVSDGALLKTYSHEETIAGVSSVKFSPSGELFGYSAGTVVAVGRNPFTSSNRPPAVAVLLQPADGVTVSPTPTFRVGLSDPDGDQVKALIEISDASGVVRTLETSLVASGSEASVSVPADQPLAEGGYTWRARAQDSNGLQSDWSAARAFTVSTANQPPAVPTLAAPSDNATVSQTPTFRVGLSDPDGDQVKAIIEISDASGVVRTLETSLVASGSEASVSVPAEQPLAAGSYTWRARAQDSNGNLSDWSAARALSVTDGVPIQLRGVGTFALIGAGVSSPDSLGLDGVELVRWDASAQRYSRVSQLQSGEGYFVKATTPVQTVLRGDPITGEFTLSLQPGWNLIAVPTLTAVAWDLDGVQVQRGGERKNLREAQRAGWVEDYLWGWQQSADDPMSGQYQLVYDARILPGVASRLEPFQAYWIFARESCALVLNSERGRAATVAPVSDSSAWVLQIEAVRGSGFSNSVWIGIAKGRSWHAALAPAPPQGEPPVQVRVRHHEGSFAADLRSAMDRDTRWSIEVVVAPSEQPQPITLRVNNLTRLPRGVNLALIDEQSGARRPLRMAASSLSFTAPAEGGVFRFAIEPISQRALLRVLNPTVRGGSRSGEAITLGFTLTTEAQTQVQIRAGSRTVRTLSDHRTRSAGLQEFVWDGRDDSGTHLPPGAYTAEITAISSDGQTARVAVPILIRR
jgi:WD40 repeat protein/methionine-rich copper-binding protein CopC